MYLRKAAKRLKAVPNSAIANKKEVPKYGTSGYAGPSITVRIITRKALREFYEKHPQSKQQLLAWLQEAKKGYWTPDHIRRDYPNARIIKGNRVVFNICGNKYRLIVKIHYKAKPPIVFIRFVGTHAEYDKIDPETV